jgi:hypothetical protein
MNNIDERAYRTQNASLSVHFYNLGNAQAQKKNINTVASSYWCLCTMQPANGTSHVKAIVKVENIGRMGILGGERELILPRSQS